MNDLSSLIERVERATGPDRDLSVDIMLLVDPVFLIEKPSREVAKWAIGHPDLPDPRSSVDAAISLVDRRLKTFSLHTNTDPSGNGAELTWWPSGLTHFDNQVNASGVAQDLPNAIILALLLALQSSHPATASGIVERESGDAQ